MKTRLDRVIEEIGGRHGVDVVAMPNRAGSVFTTPDWTDWPADMLSEVKGIAARRCGPDADYWVDTRDDANDE